MPPCLGVSFSHGSLSPVWKREVIGFRISLTALEQAPEAYHRV